MVNLILLLRGLDITESCARFTEKPSIFQVERRFRVNPIYPQPKAMSVEANIRQAANVNVWHYLDMSSG